MQEMQSSAVFERVSRCTCFALQEGSRAKQHAFAMSIMCRSRASISGIANVWSNFIYLPKSTVKQHIFRVTMHTPKAKTWDLI